MEDLSKYTPIELQKMSNDITAQHAALKEKIIADTYEMEELEKRINENVQLLQELEKNYVEIVENLME